MNALKNQILVQTLLDKIAFLLASDNSPDPTYQQPRLEAYAFIQTNLPEVFSTSVKANPDLQNALLQLRTEHIDPQINGNRQITLLTYLQTQLISLPICD